MKNLIQNLLLCSILFLVNQIAYADTLNVYYPNNVKDVRMGIDGRVLNVSGYLNSTPVLYTVLIPITTLSNCYQVTVVGIPTKTNKLWIKKVD